MKEYLCSVCGYIFGEAAGDPDNGVAPGTKWGDIPEDWVCPVCGASKDEFTMKSPDKKPEIKGIDAAGAQAHHEQLREMSFGELSALCSNLSKGCEKQYRTEEAECFNQLAAYYKSKSVFAGQKQFSNLNNLIQQNLNSAYTQAGEIAAGVSDRGALRALVWGEKVTKILSSLLARYEKQKNSMLENTNIYVCEICGFVFIGNDAPEICPVCKVPRMKLQQIKREAV